MILQVHIVRHFVPYTYDYVSSLTKFYEYLKTSCVYYSKFSFNLITDDYFQNISNPEGYDSFQTFI